MKKILILIIIVLLGCKQTSEPILKKEQKKEQTSIQLLDIKKYLGEEKWIEITPKENGFINYKKCDADNRNIQIKNNRFIENTGQEVFKCKLLNIIKIDSLRYKIAIEKDCSYGNIFYLKIVDKDKKIIKWDLYYGHSIYTTPNSLIKNYKKVVQPCTECFPPEECP